MGTFKKKRKRQFNSAGGMHSRPFKKRLSRLSQLKNKLETVKTDCYYVKKKKNVGLILSKMCVKKAKRYIYSRNDKNLKVTFNKVDSESQPGNRILNLNELQGFVSKITAHCATCDIARRNASDGCDVVKLISENRSGFYTVLRSQCVCGEKFLLKNSTTVVGESGNVLQDINVRAVWGSMVTGGGCSSLEESMGTIGIPSVNQKQYSKLENDIGKWWQKVLYEEMKEAGEEEKNYAISQNSFFQGIPAITVIRDGGWSKRSHKHSYNAMGGVGVIFGQHTGKLLHIGVRNRLCYVCKRAYNEKSEPKDHECYQIWTQSAQSMESDVIVEGFQQCEQKYGVRYMKVIADGDSSVYRNIQDQVPVWGNYVQKIECANHSCKCLRVHLERLTEDKPQYKGKGKLSKINIQRIVTGVRCAIKMRSQETDRSLAIDKLQTDIRNAGRHVLGLHDLCSKDFCKHSVNLAQKSSEDCVKDMNEDDDDDDDVIHDQCDFWNNCVAKISDSDLLQLRVGEKKPLKNQ